MRGSVLDVIMIPVIFLVLLLTIGAMYYANEKIKAGFQEANMDTTYIEEQSANYILLSKGMVFFLVMLMLIIGIMAYLIPTHPIFFPITLVAIGITYLIAKVVQDVGIQYLNALGIAEQLATMTLLLIYLDKVILVASFLVAIAMYSFGKKQLSAG